MEDTWKFDVGSMVHGDFEGPSVSTLVGSLMQSD